MGKGLYRDGWQRCCSALANTGFKLVVEDFFERSFGLDPVERFHDRPFVAFFHYPPDPDLPDLGGERFAPTYAEMFAARGWKLSADKLQAAVCFSSHLARYLERFVRAPVVVLKHPTETAVRRWSIDAFSERPRMVQIGEFYRDTRAIFRVRTPWERSRLLDTEREWVARWDDAVRRHAEPTMDAGVLEILRVTDDEYDDLLSNCVVVSSMFCASGSNVVVECIARSTPLLVNRIPPVVEYLGDDYPLYLDRVDPDSPGFIEQVASASRHLDRLDKRWLSYRGFAGGFVRALSGVPGAF